MGLPALNLARSAGLVAALALAPGVGGAVQGGARGGAAEPEDPGDVLVERLRKHAYFSKVAWREHGGYSPLRVLIQSPAVETPNYDQATAQFFAPWFQEVERLFVERHARPLGLERRDERLVSALFVLLSEGDYQNYLRVAALRDPASGLAAFDAKLGLVVTVGSSFGGVATPHQKRWLALREHVRALMEAYGMPGGGSACLWLREGLADYLAFHIGSEPACLAEPTLNRDYLRALAEALRNPSAGALVTHRLEELFALSDVKALPGVAGARAAAAGLDAPDAGTAFQAFYAEACLWTHFLLHGQDGAHAAAYQRFLASELAGQGDLARFREAFAGVDLGLLDQQFFAWLGGEHQRVMQVPADFAPLLKALRARPAGVPTAAPATPTGSRERDALALELGDEPGWLALAVARAASGDAEGARTLLLAQRERLGEGELRARVERELERVEAWMRLRDAWLADAVAQGKRIKLTAPGATESFLVKVERIERDEVPEINGGGAELVLGVNKAKLERLPLAALVPEALSAQMARDMPPDTPPWVRAWAALLAGDERWDRRLEGPDADALRADAPGYAALVREGAVADALERLAQAGPPADAAAARQTIERLGALAASRADARVAARLPALRALAAGAWRLLYDRASAEIPLAARVERLDGARLRLTYAFDSADELADFPALPEYLGDWRATMPAVESDVLAIDGGELRLEGRACLRHVVTFRAPLAVRYSSYYKAGPGGENDATTVLVGLLADEAGSYEGTTDWGHAYVIDLRHGRSEMVVVPQEQGFYMERIYRREVRRDADGKLRALVDDAPVNEVAASSREAGFVFLFAHTLRPVLLTELVIEGEPDEAGWRMLEERWLAARQAELGLGE